MKKNVLIIIGLLLALSLFSCSKKSDEGTASSEKKESSNAFSEYVDKNVETLDKSKELSKDATERVKEMEKMTDDMNKAPVKTDDVDQTNK